MLDFSPDEEKQHNRPPDNNNRYLKQCYLRSQYFCKNFQSYQKIMHLKARLFQKKGPFQQISATSVTISNHSSCTFPMGINNTDLAGMGWKDAEETRKFAQMPFPLLRCILKLLLSLKYRPNGGYVGCSLEQDRGSTQSSILKGPERSWKLLKGHGRCSNDQKGAESY